MNIERILEMGYYPYNEINEKSWHYIRKDAMFNYFDSFSSLLEFVTKNDLPQEELYVSSGFYELVLFDGKWTVYELTPVDGYDFNTQWQALKDKNSKKITDNNYLSLIRAIPKSQKMSLLHLNWNSIPKKLRRELILEVRQNSEYSFKEFDKVVFIPWLLKTKDEAPDLMLLNQAFQEETLMIYRGETHKSTEIEHAYSWSLSLEQGRFFAERFGPGGKLYKAKVRRADVIAYLEGEKEVLVPFDKVMNLKEVTY